MDVMFSVCSLAEKFFNSSSLRLELEASGFVFSSNHSDTEVLFALLQKERHHALPKLNGMFAFAFSIVNLDNYFAHVIVWVLNPFYYTHQSGLFAFASELKSLLFLYPL